MFIFQNSNERIIVNLEAIVDLENSVKLKNINLLIILTLSQPISAELAVIIKPVIDFTYLPIQSHQRIPICPVKVGDDAISCPRIHQGLFNEIVDIVRTEDQQALVAVKNCFFQTNKSLDKLSQFWTAQENLLLLTNLGPHQAHIPAPIDFAKPDSLYNAQIVTLISPYYSTITNQTYSAGTRFVLVSDTGIYNTNSHSSSNNENNLEISNNHSTSHYQVYIYDPKLNKIIIEQLDKKRCLKLSEDLLDYDHGQHRQLFITILQQWVNHPVQLSSGPFTIEELTATNTNKKTLKTKKLIPKSKHKQLKANHANPIIKRYIQPRPIAPFIPYVWGGCSYTTLCTDPYFQLKTVRSKKRPHAKPRRYFEYPTSQTQPYNGFDCAGLILRAAQASGIPYFYKNTATILQNLEPLQPEDQVANGDLIWLPAHIMIISDVEHNLCIEARHYAQGYGKVHETPIHKIFKDINNYQDLRAAHFSQSLVDRLDRHQKSAQKVKIKILKLKMA